MENINHLQLEGIKMKAFNHIFAIIILILLAGQVSALELNPFATIKIPEKQITPDMNDFLKEDFNSKYGVIRLSDTFLWIESDKIAEYSLTKNTEQCLIDCEAEGKAILYRNMSLFDDMKFYNKFGGLRNLDYKIYILGTEEYIEETPIYEEICKDITDLKNGTINKVCQNVQIDIKKETKTREVWKEYNNEVLPVGNYKWKLEGKKNPVESVDFVPATVSKELSEWAWWDSNWKKKKQITNLTGSIVQLNISYDSDMQSDFDDIRFIDSSETTELNYFIDYKSDNNSAIVRVAINTNSIYMYYGNPEASSTSNVSKVYNNNLKALWTGENINGNKLIDAFKANNGTIQGNTISRAGKVGNSLYFDGNSDYVNISYNSALQPPHVTWCVWANRTDATWNPYLTTGFNSWIRKTPATENAYSMSVANGNIATSANIISDLNKWVFVCGRYDKTRINVTENNVQVATLSTTIDIDYDPIDIWIGAQYWDLSNSFMGQIDEVMIFDEAINHTELTRIYNTNVPNAVFETEESVNSLSVTLNSPTNYYNSPSLSITFNCSAIDDTAVLNLTLIIDGQDNYTITNISANQNLSLQITRTLSEGSHNWTCRASDGSGEIGDPYTAITRYLTIDVTPPIVNILNPLNGSNVLTFNSSINVDFNVSVSDNIALSNCWYYNDTANNSITCGNNATLNLSNGYHTLIYYANDSAGNIGYNSTTFLINLISFITNYSTTAIEGENITIYFNLTANKIDQANATLIYNNTAYPMYVSSSNSTKVAFYRTVTAPIVNADTFINFSINYSINEASATTSNYSQLIYNIPSPLVSISPCNGIAYSFNLKDEENLTNINGTIKYNFAYGLSNSSIVIFNGTLQNTNTMYICFNYSISNSWIIGYGELEYSSPGYTSRRYYIFDNTNITNSTSSNITLFDLLSASATSFQLILQKNDLTPLPNYYSALLRWYPELNQYNNVEMSRTDDKGESVFKVKTEDVDYRIGIYNRNGTLIKLLEPIRMVCLSTPCKYSVYINLDTTDYTSFQEVQTSLTFNETTKRFTLIWNDPSQKTQSMNLTVYKGDDIVCSSSGIGYVNVITCDVTGQTGLLRAVAYRTASPQSIITSIYAEITSRITDISDGKAGLIVAAILSMLMALMGVYSPIAAIVLACIGLIPAYLLGGITIAVGIGFGLLGGLVIWTLIKRV